MNALDGIVIVMAKAPLPGLAKTRLAPALGPQGAANAAQVMLDHALQEALSWQQGVAQGAVHLCCAPEPTHAAWQPCVNLAAKRPSLTLHAQGEGDLGARMARAMARALAQANRVVMTGTDAPAVDSKALRAAFDALDHHDAVFVPAFDGGYALIGVKQHHAPLFDAMPWSTPEVMAITRARMRHAGLSHLELAPVHDIDEPDDLVHWPQSWPRLTPLQGA